MTKIRSAPTITLTVDERMELTKLVRSKRSSIRLDQHAQIVLLGDLCKDKALHLIADNYAPHKHPVVQEWLAEHPRIAIDLTTLMATQIPPLMATSNSPT